MDYLLDTIKTSTTCRLSIYNYLPFSLKLVVLVSDLFSCELKTYLFLLIL